MRKLLALLLLISGTAQAVTVQHVTPFDNAVVEVGGSDYTPNLGTENTDWAADDLYVCLPISHASGSRTFAAETGWTNSITTVETGAFLASRPFHRVMVAADGNPTFDHSSGGGGAAVACIAFRGIDTTTPLDATITSNTGIGLTMTAPTATSVTANALVARVYIFGENGTTSIGTYSQGTEQLDVTTANSQDATLAIATHTQVTAGAVGTATAVASGGAADASDDWIAFTIILRPAAGATCDLTNNETIAIPVTDGLVDLSNCTDPPEALYLESGDIVPTKDGTTNTQAIVDIPLSAFLDTGFLSRTAIRTAFDVTVGQGSSWNQDFRIDLGLAASDFSRDGQQCYEDSDGTVKCVGSNLNTESYPIGTYPGSPYNEFTNGTAVAGSSVTSTLFPGENAWSMDAGTAGRVFIFHSPTLSVDANTDYVFSVHVEANPDSLRTTELISVSSQPTGASFSSVDPNYVPVAGDRIYGILSVAGTAGTAGLRWGPGSTGTENGSAILSGIQFEKGISPSTYTSTDGTASGDIAAINSTTGVLLEGSSTNLVEQAIAFDDAWWFKGSTTVTANSDTAPNGTLTADTLDATSVFSSVRNNTAITVTASTDYTWSFYAKRGTATDVKYSVYCTNLATNIIGSTSYYSQINSDTYTRVEVAFTTPAGCTGVFVYPRRDDAIGTSYAWGGQLEQSGFMTSLIITAGSTVTRAATAFSEIDLSAVESSWGDPVNGLGFHVILEAAHDSSAITVDSPIFSLSPSAFNTSGFTVYYNDPADVFTLIKEVGGTNTTLNSTVSWSAGDPLNLRGSFTSAGTKFWVNSEEISNTSANAQADFLNGIESLFIQDSDHIGFPGTANFKLTCHKFYDSVPPDVNLASLGSTQCGQ